MAAMSAWLILAATAASAAETAADLIHEAKLAARRQDAQGALELLQRAQALAPGGSEALTLKGNVHMYLLRDAASGESAYRQALAIDPTAWDASFFLAKSISSQSRAEEAALAFDAAATLQPSNLATRLEQGAAWLAVGSFLRASEAYLAAFAADPHSPQPLLARARAAASAGEAPEVVLSAWRDATETHPWAAATLVEHAEAVRLAAEAGAVHHPSSAAPTACELLDAALLLEPGRDVPAGLMRFCEAQQRVALGGSSMAGVTTDEETAAVAAHRGGACASLARCAPQLAVFATSEGGASMHGRPRADQGSCTVSVPAQMQLRFTCGLHGLHVPVGLALSISGPPAASTPAADVAAGLILDAAHASRHFIVEGELTLARLTLRRGRATLSSGGAVLLLPGGSLTATDSRFDLDRAALGSGGAIAALGDARVSLRRVALRGNSATWRGGAVSMQPADAADAAASSAAGGAGLSLRDGGGVGGTGGGEGDESGGHVGLSDSGRMVWQGNVARFGGADVHDCRAALLPTVPEGVRFAACSEPGGAGRQQAAAGVVVGGGMLQSLEAQAAAGELQEMREVDATVAVALLQQATEADPDCPSAVMSRLSLLYSSGMDAIADDLLASWEARKPGHPTISAARAVLSNASVPALRMRAQRLTSHAAAMREGRPSAARHNSRLACQDAATDAFVQALGMAPADGDTWHDLATSLFFAGELAESERCYAEGLRRVPGHAKLLHEAETWRTFAPSASEEAVATGGRASFADDDFERVELPEGSYADRPGSVDIHMGEAYLGAKPAVWVSRAPLLSRDECARAIASAETWAKRNGGWTTKRHFSVPTTDVPLSSLPDLLPWFNRALATSLFPALLSRYPQAADRPSQLRMLDAFLVRYAAGAQTELPTHADQGQLSFTIMLNDPSEYEGGGTWFPELNRSLDGAAAGHVVLFPSKVQHGGRSISKGVRYIVVLFCGVDANRSGRTEGYVLEDLQRRWHVERGAAGKDEL